ncbi:dTDP-4-dehydrorhamnose 3,5-epimerase family protein [Vibrio aestuarianus]|uniref:dTDP-4-dehydrorhamnose 3,5-epimerase n=2 Tax=Vibrio aestuarianus TaxID=28171 RepID=A0ABM9FLF7_9VIBR|nr:dTDP-4-dehydrorhamnose 3,5-epimerase family protein [Vibrio aestuarianus]MDE1212720.1 dTDP-4-dehydrorhamnose 3,5-epimerase family protein [Vibrio aestuarianus]MDE1215646.1 dTDP-4-dehydrorhamnose 3,5-epimerase family protein [Vibrio aestuarianus]MDE1226941.1 dTDP-4-dehydrorhamnose 3,5-epimerase family protein [Vibrio aestuarianus]MDE1255413.1 dTDP-4-dehydrorhamnose 3,5-epimerase family protein [Vibrio aestuarianus]MDE1259748.1 dTDP-4-dehydrorhamnose 3,5-epimerase family protein [Vibrio aestu
MQIKKTKFEGLFIIKMNAFEDDRGSLTKFWLKNDLSEVMSECEEAYFSYSKSKTFRGLHYQSAGKAQGKYIVCVNGNVLDVAVDLRPNSATFGEVFLYDLCENSKEALYIPEGFAHGFYSYTKSIVLNLSNSKYSPGDELCFLWSSISALNNLDVQNISAKDTNGLILREYLNEISNSRS